MNKDAKKDYFKFYLLIMVIYIGVFIFCFFNIYSLSILSPKILTYYSLASTTLVSALVLFGCGLYASKNEKLIFPVIITILSLVYIIFGAFLTGSSFGIKGKTVIEMLMSLCGTLAIINMFRTDSKVTYIIPKVLSGIDIIIHLVIMLELLGVKISFISKNLKLVLIILFLFGVFSLLLPALSEIFTGGHDRPKNDYETDDYLSKVRDKTAVGNTPTNVFNASAATTPMAPKSVIEPTPQMPNQNIGGTTLSAPTPMNNQPLPNMMNNEVDNEPPKW